MSIVRPISFDSVDRYLRSKRGIWAETTIATAGPKLNKLIRMKTNSPMEMLEELRARDHSPYTIQVYFEIWRGFERYCNDGKSVTDDFMKKNRGLFRNAYQNKTFLLTLEEFNTLLTNARAKSDGLYNLLMLMGGSGLRLSEALAAKWDDIGADEMIRVVGKGGKVRLVPMSMEKLIPKEVIGHEKIAGKSPPYRRFFNGLPCSPHDLRAFFATTLSSICTPSELMDLLGHNNFNTVLKYIRRNPTIIKGKLNDYFKNLQGDNGPADQGHRRKGQGR